MWEDHAKSGEHCRAWGIEVDHGWIGSRKVIQGTVSIALRRDDAGME